MNNIPTRLRAELAEDPEYKTCVFHGTAHGPTTKIEWHHNFIYAGKQLQERWCILPICVAIHEKANWKQVRERLDWIMYNRADDDTLRFYSKARNLIRMRDQLNKKYGNEKNQSLL